MNLFDARDQPIYEDNLNIFFVSHHGLPVAPLLQEARKSSLYAYSLPLISVKQNLVEKGLEQIWEISQKMTRLFGSGPQGLHLRT